MASDFVLVVSDDDDFDDLEEADTLPGIPIAAIVDVTLEDELPRPRARVARVFRSPVLVPPRCR